MFFSYFYLVGLFLKMDLGKYVLWTCKGDAEWERDQEAQGAVLKQPRLEDSEPNYATYVGCNAYKAGHNIPNLSNMDHDLKTILGPIQRPKKRGEAMSEEGEKSKRRLFGKEVNTELKSTLKI